MTLTISAADLATVRLQSGDNSTAYEVSDAQIDAIYTSTTEGKSNVYRTAYYVAVRRWGLAVNSTGISNQYGSVTANQKFEQLERLLRFLGGITGLGFGVGGVTVGSNSVNVYRADSDQVEEPDYSNGAL